MLFYDIYLCLKFCHLVATVACWAHFGLSSMHDCGGQKWHKYLHYQDMGYQGNLHPAS